MRNLIAALAATVVLSTSFFTNPVKVKAEIKPATVFKISAEKQDSAATVDPALELYTAIDFSNGERLSEDVFRKALKGYENLKKAGKLSEGAHILSICDFSLSSNAKRLWVIDTETKKVLFNSLVAHGKNTGEEFATHFSNTENSLQSSMGFFITEDTYEGENGYSLKLEGVDGGYNDAAMRRAIVMHGADYVSPEFAAQHKRIGRSWGCPAVPRELAAPIINTVKGKNCLFIYYPDQAYLSSSRWLNS